MADDEVDYEVFPAANYIVSMPLMFAFFYIMHEVFRRYVKFATAFYLLVLLTFPAWGIQPLDGWFEWAKTFSVLIPTQLLNFVRFSYTVEREPDSWFYKYKDTSVFQACRKGWITWGIYLVLFLNIAEASLKDLVLGNYFNAVAGLLLNVTLPWPAPHALWEPLYEHTHVWQIDILKDEYMDFVCAFPLGWSIMYCLWNGAFTYDDRRLHFPLHVCILSMTLVRSVWNHRNDLWFSARAYSLSLHIAIWVNYDVYGNFMDGSSWSDDTVIEVWGFINMLLMFLYLAWWGHHVYHMGFWNAHLTRVTRFRGLRTYKTMRDRRRSQLEVVNARAHQHPEGEAGQGQEEVGEEKQEEKQEVKESQAPQPQKEAVLQEESVQQEEAVQQEEVSTNQPSADQEDSASVSE